MVHGVSYVDVNNAAGCPILKMLGLEDLLAVKVPIYGSVKNAVAGK